MSYFSQRKLQLFRYFYQNKAELLKKKKIKNHLGRFKEKIILFEKKDFNKKFRLIRSQGIVINFITYVFYC